MRQLAISSAVCVLTLFAGPATLFAAVPTDQILDEARGKLRSNHAEALVILEEAVRAFPQRIDCWTELNRALYQSYSSSLVQRGFVLECTARAALAANPGSPELLFDLARILQPSAALDV